MKGYYVTVNGERISGTNSLTETTKRYGAAIAALTAADANAIVQLRNEETGEITETTTVTAG